MLSRKDLSRRLSQSGMHPGVLRVGQQRFRVSIMFVQISGRQLSKQFLDDGERGDTAVLQSAGLLRQCQRALEFRNCGLLATEPGESSCVRR